MSDGWGPLLFVAGVAGVGLAAWEIYRVMQANSAGAYLSPADAQAAQNYPATPIASPPVQLPPYSIPAVPGYSYAPQPYYPPAPGSTSPLGIRENNPGNLQPGGHEARYPTMQAGITAAMNNVLAYSTRYHLNTVAGIINRWAPPSQNDTQAYIHYVAQHLGVQPTQQISVRSPLTMYDLLMAIFAYENNGQTPDASLVNSVITSKLGSVTA